MLRACLASLLTLVTNAGMLACSNGTSPAVYNPQEAGGTPNSTAPTSPTSGGGVGATSQEDAAAPQSEEPCTDLPPPPDVFLQTCFTLLQLGECESESMQGYCDATCGRCTLPTEVEPEPTEPVDEGPTWDSVVPSGTSDVTPLGSNAAQGWASRFWDCCKPHCAWSDNTSSGVVKMCSMSNSPLGDPNAQSSCDGGPAFVCWDMAPWAVSQNLAYGYAATPAGGLDCGKCYQLDFTGTGQHRTDDPGSVAIAGKTMIVQAINTGGDVTGGQFDIMVPGGGVGANDSCSRQWGTSELGKQYGGFVSACGADKDCVATMCFDTFSKSGMESLLAGCLFYVEWFEAANNPQLRYRQVSCPPELENKSGLRD